MKIKISSLIVFFVCFPSNNSFAQAPPAKEMADDREHIIPMADSVKIMAENLIKTGFTAGDGYAEVWIRDLNTFMEVSCEVNDKDVIRKHLLVFFQLQQPDGGILDGYVPKPKSSDGGYDYYYSPLAPQYAGHKNTVETDQETSLIQAIAKYIRFTGDRSILKEKVASVPVQDRLEQAMQFLLNERFNEEYGLIWGATTADWGDVQPEHEWGVELNEDSHLALDVYDNAMFVIAINDFLEVAEIPNKNRSYWLQVRNGLKENIRKYLWKEESQKFEPHIYLEESPFPKSFDESKIYYHGGTAVAIEAGLLSKEEVTNAYNRMQENVKNSNASTIGLTLYPPYPKGYFKNPGMSPYSYQNGGDWTWFGGRMISQLIRYDLIPEACEALKPMMARVLKNKGFYEWYTPDNQPKGSSSFRGSAGVLWTAIRDLENNLN